MPPTPKSAPRASASLSASARDFNGLKARLEGIAAAMRNNQKFQVKKFELGAPSKTASSFAQLSQYAAVFDGAQLEWELRGVEKTSGKLMIPKSSEIAQSQGKGIAEDGKSFVVLSGLQHASVEWSPETDDISVLEKSSKDAKADGLTLLAAFDAAVDSLGVKGWELRYFDDFGDDDDDELFDAQGEVLDSVDRAWAALGLKAP